jgi:capsular exopolysaccharide synthesis family protein
VIGSIPKSKSNKVVLSADNNPPSSDYSQAFQHTSDQIYLLSKDKQLTSFLLVDAEGANGTAAMIANLGINLAGRADNKVLIIDANLRDPSIAKAFDIADSPGLADVLQQRNDFVEAIKILSPNLHVLPAGKTKLNPIVLLESLSFSDMLNIAKEHYNLIFVSCADIKNYSDSVIVSSSIDGIVLVINEGKVRRQAVKGAITPLEQKKANLVGVILNNRTYDLPGIIYRLT